MKKTFDLGKIDYLGNGQKQNKVTVEVGLEEREYMGKKQLVFSACGNIWNHRMSDIYSGGQNLNEIKRYKKNDEIFNKIYKFWKLYHCNDLHAGCEHQRKLGWEKDGYDKHPSEKCPECGYKFGTEWKYQEIPSEDLEAIKELSE